VSIIPRGRALGVTMFLPTEDKYSNSKQQLESQISTLYGGRIAEEMIYGADAVTTGASNDIERATEIAQSMVTKWGLSDHMGPLAYGVEDDGNFLGQGSSKSKAVSDVTAKQIDEDVRAVINRNYQRAEQVLTEHNDKLHTMAKLLMKYETIDSDQIDAIMEGREPGEPKGWSNDNPTPTPPPSADVTDSETAAKPADLLH